MPKKTIAFLLAAAAFAAAQTPPKQPAEKQERDLKLEKDEPTAPPKSLDMAIPRSYAVVIGISRYQNLPESQQLAFAERDAQSMYTILISTEGGGYKAENVHVLAGAKATLAGLRREIDTWLPSVAKEDDRVLIYFAGHGFIHEGKGYLAPYDFNKDKIAATGYPMDDLGSIMGGKIKAKSKILLTDSCHSGAITPEDSAKINQTLTSLNRSLFSLTASRDREQSFESADLGGGHGVFTYYVVKGLEGEADVPGEGQPRDGIVSADELAEYVRREVREATAGKQNPTSDRGSFDPRMMLAFVPSNAPPGVPPAPKTGTLIFESNMDEVELFVDGKSVGVLSKSKPLQIPGLVPGQHTIKGVRMGYEPDGPREETVYPGQDSTVSIKILIPRRRQKAALDELDKGIDDYQKGFEQNYRKAEPHFLAALKLEPNYSQAAYYLALTYNALFDEAKAEQYFKKAIELDPDYLEAHANYGGMLLDIGNADEAIRQFNIVLVRNPNHANALANQAQAYRIKGLYVQSVEAARKAVKVAPRNSEPFFWMADSLRLDGKYADAKTAYLEYLRLSDYNSKLAGKLNYYVLGYLAGIGKKKRAATQDIWQELRSMAYFGICECERKLSQFDAAIASCQASLRYDGKDPYAHYLLGLTFMSRALDKNTLADLQPALKHFQQTIAINPDLTESKLAKQNIANIQKELQTR